MISMKSTLVAALGLAPLAFGAAHASSPDEFTLDPMGTTSSTDVYTLQPYSTTTTTETIVTQPVTGDGQFENVNINDYIIEDTTNSQ